MKKYLLVFTLMLLVGSFVFSHNVLAEVNDDFKTICIRLAGPDALLQGKCAEITPFSSSDFARLKCKEVAEALSDEDGFRIVKMWELLPQAQQVILQAEKEQK